MKTKVNSFVSQFMAMANGDNEKAVAEKAWRSAESALKSQISVKEGDAIELEDKVIEAKERLANARVNGLEVIKDRNAYVKNLVAAKNYVIEAETELEDHNSMLSFLREEYDALRKEVTVEE